MKAEAEPRQLLTVFAKPLRAVPQALIFSLYVTKSTL